MACFGPYAGSTVVPSMNRSSATGSRVSKSATVHRSRMPSAEASTRSMGTSRSSWRAPAGSTIRWVTVWLTGTMTTRVSVPQIPSAQPTSDPPPAGVIQPVVQFGGELIDLAGQLRVGLELQLLLGEVVIGLGLLEGRLPVLANHDKRGQEDRFQRHDQRQRRPRLGLDEQHPDGEYRDVNVDEVHRPREAGDPVGDPQLHVGGPPGLFLQDDGVVREFDR